MRSGIQETHRVHMPPFKGELSMSVMRIQSNYYLRRRHFRICGVGKTKPIAFRKLVRLHKLGAAYDHQTDNFHGRKSQEETAPWHDWRIGVRFSLHAVFSSRSLAPCSSSVIQLSRLSLANTNKPNADDNLDDLDRHGDNDRDIDRTVDWTFNSGRQ